ncbi:hypothetical protein N658DRAFT_227450 [Parathielavia hyrcaniae]|uniref:Uncharacterized protein n=1 Tax=Parathielavia hyrcaniae TaxID=113614 RepID=A0AAN6PZI2_9PEZI|nr:hypothetical protein N658DRAFT_227450 [Parathielavia hyrcaniae]
MATWCPWALQKAQNGNKPPLTNATPLAPGLFLISALLPAKQLSTSSLQNHSMPTAAARCVLIAVSLPLASSVPVELPSPFWHFSGTEMSCNSLIVRMDVCMHENGCSPRIPKYYTSAHEKRHFLNHVRSTNTRPLFRPLILSLSARTAGMVTQLFFPKFPFSGWHPLRVVSRPGLVSATEQVFDNRRACELDSLFGVA